MSAPAPRVGRVPIDVCDVHPHNIRRDLGDLRSLTDSIRRYGVMQPIVVETRGERLRLRAGHRRLAAARLAGLDRIPAIIHGQALDNDEWLVHSIQENVIRRGLDMKERADVVHALRAEGLTWEAIAEAFGVSLTAVRRWSTPDAAERKKSVRSNVSCSTLRARLDELRAAVTAGEVDAVGVLDAIAALTVIPGSGEAVLS